MTRRLAIPLAIAIPVVALMALALRLTAVDAVATPPRPSAQADTGTYGLGTVEARVLSRIGFDASGTVAALLADHGDRVRQGQVLARLDSREQRAALAQAEATLHQAEAGLAQAQSRLQRAHTAQALRRSVNLRRQNLVRAGTVSTEAAEDAQSNADMAGADVAVAASDVEAARGGLDAARAQLQLAQVMLDKHSLTAPYDALVVERSRELGTALAAGTPLFTIIDPATVWVQAFVDEARAGPLRVGQRATISLRSQPHRQFSGHVARVDIESDRVSEERKVEVAFDRMPEDLHLGEQAEVLIATTDAGS